jgi:flavin reductase (DIM6/NTAB) family NADH-FMN oxidoreductase RutF
MEKVYFKGLDMLKPNVLEATKMPRTCVMPVARDKDTGYLNVGAYSGGVMSIRPYHVVFGVKSYSSMELFKNAGEFTVAVGSMDQVDNIWAVAFRAPKGIDEIELADWHELEPAAIGTPGIRECRLNLECRKVACYQPPNRWHAVVIGEVVAVRIDGELAAMARGEAERLLPTHEGGMYINDGRYGLSNMSGEISPPARPAAGRAAKPADGRITISGKDLYKKENEAILAHSVFPRPSYIVLTNDENGKLNFEAVSMGYIQSTEPAVHIPLSKNSACYKNIKRTRRFVVAFPTRDVLDKFAALNGHAPADLASAGFTTIAPNMFDIPGLAECPINLDCKAEMVEDVPGADYALVLGIKVGCVEDRDLADAMSPELHVTREIMEYTNEFFGKLIYKVLDTDMTDKWTHYDANGTVPIKPIPTWGSRYAGAWWAEDGSRLPFWLIELCQERILTKREYEKIMTAVRLWNEGNGVTHLKEYYTPELKRELRERLTKLFKLMIWAQRDLEKWDRVHAFLDGFPDPALTRGHHNGPLYAEKWGADEYM